MARVTESTRQSLLRLILALLLFLSVPLLETLAARASRELQVHLDRRGTVEEYKSRYLALQETLQRMEKSLPWYEEALVLLDELLRLGRASGVRVESIRSRRASGRGEVRFLHVELPVSGAYGQVKDFILRLESTGKILGIESVENNPRSGRDGDLALVLGLTLPFREVGHARN